jgi:hypothetical protein
VLCHLATDHGLLVDAMKDEKEVDLTHVRSVKDLVRQSNYLILSVVLLNSLNVLLHSPFPAFQWLQVLLPSLLI